MMMSSNTCIITLFLMTLTTVINGGTSPTPAVDCSTVILSMANCLSYVQSGSNVTTPEAGCCPGLKTVLDTSVDCLCETYKDSAKYGITLDRHKAATLPAACKITTPVPTCGMSMPAGAPSGVGMPPTGSAGGPTSTGASETAPAATPASASSMITFSVGRLLIGLFAASLITIF